MMSEELNAEFWAVLVVMVLTFVFGLVAVGVFIRVWRKERRGKKVNLPPSGPGPRRDPS